MGTTTDSQLLSAARNGDTTAYGQLFADYEKRIYSYAYGIAGNAEDARDICQEAFMRVFEAIPRKTGELNFSAYLYRTAHNIAIDEVKQRNNFTAPDSLDLEAEPALQANPERVALLREQQEQTWRATFQLSDNHREVLTLRELHDMSYQQIAEVTGMSSSAVGVTLSRARLKFKEVFRMSSVDTEGIAKECEGMLGLISAYIDDELSAEDRARVDAHLEECAFCHLALEEMTEASRSYRALLPLLPPPDIAEAVMAKYGADASASMVARTVKKSRDWSLAAKIAATAGLLLVLGLVSFGNRVFGEDGLGISGGDADLELSADITPTSPADKITTEPTEELLTGAPMAEAPVEDTEPVDDVEASTIPETPRLVSPADGAVVSTSEISFIWRFLGDKTDIRYILEIAEYSYDEERYVALQPIGPLTDTSYLHTPGSGALMWRVYAIDAQENESAPTEWRTLSRSITLLPILPEIVPPTLY